MVKGVTIVNQHRLIKIRSRLVRNRLNPSKKSKRKKNLITRTSRLIKILLWGSSPDGWRIVMRENRAWVIFI